MPFGQRIDQKMIAWIAVFAILCQALMPSIAHMRVNPVPDNLADFCSVRLAEAAYAPGKSHDSPLEKFNAPRCGYCVAGISFAPPPSFQFLVRASEAFVSAARFFSFPAPGSFKRISPPPRGPPFSLA